MMKPTRDDLRFIIEDDDVEPLVMWVSDADLAAMGYVKLDVDVEALREQLEWFDRTATVHRADPPPIEWQVARQVLAALDGEEVTFQGRLAASMERHRHILDRLADGEEA